MKIRKVKWTNHPILGNLELDFVNPVTNHPFQLLFCRRKWEWKNDHLGNTKYLPVHW